MQCYKRLQAVYFPTKKRLKVKGIRIDNDDGEQIILSQPEDVQAALASYWGEVYAHKEGDYDSMSKLMTYYIRQQRHFFNFCILSVLEFQDYEVAIRRAKHSASGPDGVPYAA